MPLHFTLLLVLLTLMSPLPAVALESDTVSLPVGVDAVIGGKPFVLPDTSALEKTDNGAARDFARRLLTPGKRLLAVWTDARQPAQGDRYVPVRYRYAVAYSMLAVETVDASAEDFGYARMAVRDELGNLTGTAALRLPETLEELGRQMASRQQDLQRVLQLRRPVAVELMQDDGRRISYLALQPAPPREAGAEGETRWLMGCMNTLLLKGKLLQVNVFSEFAAAADTEWLRQECTRLVGAVQSRN